MTEQDKVKIVLDVDEDIEEEQESVFDLSYRWRLRVTNANGEQLKDDFVPHNDSVVFVISRIEKRLQLSLENENRNKFLFRDSLKPDDPDEEYTQTLSSVESFSALLTPFDRFLAPDYHFFGSNKKIDEIYLHVNECDPDRASLRAVPAYETDFDSFPDRLFVNVDLKRESFRDLRDRIEKTQNNGDVGHLVLNGTSGFYARDSLADPQKIFVLSNDTPVENVPGDHRVPRLGVAGLVSINVSETKEPEETNIDTEPRENADMMEIKESLKFLETQTKEQTRGLGVTNGLLLVLVIFGLAILFRGT